MREKLSLAWAIATFGEKRGRSRRERAARLLEEAIELGQSAGLAASDARALIDQVYAKPAGDLKQEVGGVIVTLACFCGLNGFKIDDCFEAEFARCITAQEKIREKNKTKVVAFDSDEN